MAIDYRGTIDNNDDDISCYRYEFVNQDGVSYVPQGVQTIAEDHDGKIWMGTNTGLFVIDNPDDWFNDDFRVTQVKVPRNDGTNLADYLLYGLPVVSIAVDGVNRKWIGTEGNGVFLVSADGTEILHQFTTDNSPLPSNTINSIAIHPRTGEVMLGTQAGLISYQGDATNPEGSLEEGNITISPNPVRPEHTTGVNITGLTLDADVMIVTSGGQLVAAGTSLGGAWHWDLRTFGGRHAAAGVYYVVITTSDGKTAVAGMLTVIR
jgi:ligand-binding sensor domain-containing protein